MWDVGGNVDRGRCQLPIRTSGVNVDESYERPGLSTVSSARRDSVRLRPGSAQHRAGTHRTPINTGSTFILSRASRCFPASQIIAASVTHD